MVSRFRLELDVAVNVEAVPAVIATARRRYAADGNADVFDGSGGAMPIREDDFIDTIEGALIELVERSPLLDDANVEIECVTCRPTSASSEVGVQSVEPLKNEIHSSADDAEVTEAEEADDDIEEFETGLYLCRWPNGEFSLVKAENRKDAVVQLDEWAGAEPTWLVPVDTCMIDFRLNDRGEIELGEFGEETAEFIWEKCYPKLDEVLSSEEVLKQAGGGHNPHAAKKIRKAVEHERKRLWNSQGKQTAAKTALGRELQKRLGTVGPVADHYVEIAANEILKAKSGNLKPN
jgi:hypothetical protein